MVADYPVVVGSAAAELFASRFGGGGGGV
jgi:hypothetical protein